MLALRVYISPSIPIDHPSSLPTVLFPFSFFLSLLISTFITLLLFFCFCYQTEKRQRYR